MMVCPLTPHILAHKMEIRTDDLSGRNIRALLERHLADAYSNSPADCVFALPIDALKEPNITFWSIWKNSELLGCGALKQLTNTHGEIKSMRTANTALGRGVGSKMLAHIIKAAKTRGMARLSLETGENEAYAQARALYTKFGFEVCGPFADYKESAFSVFMTLDL